MQGSGEFFDEISEKPVAAASLAQVYRARLTGTDTYVAVKVQRPEILSTVSKDLYVLRRAAEVYQVCFHLYFRISFHFRTRDVTDGVFCV